MMRYAMQDGTVVDTDKASKSWQEARDWNGANHVGRVTRSEWHIQQLYRSRRGRYYVEYTSSVTGERSRVEWVSPEAATRWLLTNDIDPSSPDFPDDLRELVDTVSE